MLNRRTDLKKLWPRGQSWAVCALLFLLSVSMLMAAETQPEGGEAGMSYLVNGTLRVGIDLDLGGSITYLAPVGGENLINNFDWGRQIQMSFYSGPVPFESGGRKPKPNWAGLGWNPIQSGDCFGHRARVLAQTNDGRTLYVKCIPMHWPLENVAGECTFESWITLEGNTVRVRSSLKNARPDRTQYPARHQELPAVYVNAPYSRLMTYTGDKPFSQGPLTRIVKTTKDDFPWVYWESSENWAALVDDREWGLGIWKPDNFFFNGGFHGKPGKGGSKDNPTGYIAPLQTEILDHNIQYDYEYTLILGTLGEIRRYVYDHTPVRRLPDYHFRSDRQHWFYGNARDTGWPVRGGLRVSLEGKNPCLIGPPSFWRAEEAPTLFVTAACRLSKGQQAKVYFRKFGEPQFSAGPLTGPQAQHYGSFELNPDGRMHTYAINLAAAPDYKGPLSGLRLDPASEGRPGDWIEVQSITFIDPRPGHEHGIEKRNAKNKQDGKKKSHFPKEWLLA